MPPDDLLRTARTPVLDLAYEQSGDPDGIPVMLLHGFPYDPRSFDDVVHDLADGGVRLIVPYLRGYGPTRFRSPDTLRSGQQAALAHDLLDLLDALAIPRAVVAGYDWGGRAACIAAALWPDRILGLVSADGYNVQDLGSADQPLAPEIERTLWYQYYFHAERGRRGLAENRDALCELLWRTWSPTWSAASAAFPASAPSFANPDFVDVVVHSYRHRFNLVDGDPAYDATEHALLEQPVITVPTVVLTSGSDGVGAPSDGDPQKFSGSYQRVHLPDTGHDVPQESPAEFAAAIRDLL